MLLVEFLLLDPIDEYRFPSLLTNFGIEDNCTSLGSSKFVETVEKKASGLLLFNSRDRELKTFSFDAFSLDTTDISLLYELS
jgi:hypothetical protein